MTMSEITIDIKNKDGLWNAKSNEVDISCAAETRSELMSHIFGELRRIYGSYPDVDMSKYIGNEKVVKQRLVDLKSINFIGDI